MQLTSIISSTLGLSKPWRITNVVFTPDRRQLDITIDCDQDDVGFCPICGMPGTLCNVETKTWFHSDFFHYQTYLHTNTPRFSCCHNFFNVEPPWSRGSKFVVVQ